ncbi:hypothetical protein BS78_10G171300 [Paspalum vaginatum]|nr:hypothetical protein BS78_10G171300 [Paspalum vaginatum]
MVLSVICVFSLATRTGCIGLADFLSDTCILVLHDDVMIVIYPNMQYQKSFIVVVYDQMQIHIHFVYERTTITYQSDFFHWDLDGELLTLLHRSVFILSMYYLVPSSVQVMD